LKKALLLLISSFLTSIFVFAQSPGALPGASGNVLTGSVKDSATGKPLPGVSVFLNGTSKGTVTRADGAFVLGKFPRDVMK